MPWDFKDDYPIYLQIIKQMQRQIVSGLYEPGARLPAVRDLAQQAAVNPNTMQKALAELEKTGLIYSQRTNGRFITEDTARIAQVRTELANQEITEFIEKMNKLGYRKEELPDLIKR